MSTFEFKNLHQKNYFEGWYFRFTESKTKKNYAIISAITYNEEHPHVFIQSFHDTLDKTTYYTYDINSLQYHNNTVQINKNELSMNHIQYDLKDISIDLQFTTTTTLQDLNGPNSAMGYLSKAPLECFQEVLILDGKAKGTINGTSAQGTIYMEKTYGRKFPTKWIWIQSNHNMLGDAISFSVGKVPVLGLQIPGFLCILKTHHKTYRFSTYNLSRIKVMKDLITIKKGLYKITLIPNLSDPCLLVGPSKHAKMNLDVYESINSSCEVIVTKRGKEIYRSTFYHAGMELMY